MFNQYSRRMSRGRNIQGVVHDIRVGEASVIILNFVINDRQDKFIHGMCNSMLCYYSHEHSIHEGLYNFKKIHIITPGLTIFFYLSEIIAGKCILIIDK